MPPRQRDCHPGCRRDKEIVLFLVPTTSDLAEWKKWIFSAPGAQKSTGKIKSTRKIHGRGNRNYSQKTALTNSCGAFLKNQEGHHFHQEKRWPFWFLAALAIGKLHKLFEHFQCLPIVDHFCRQTNSFFDRICLSANVKTGTGV